jgi:hypothetical protein
MEMQQLPLCGSRLVLIGAPFGMPLARSFAGEGKRHAGCALFRNQRDARVRVLRNSATSYFRIRVNRRRAPRSIGRVGNRPQRELFGLGLVCLTQVNSDVNLVIRDGRFLGASLAGLSSQTHKAQPFKQHNVAANILIIALHKAS